MTAQVWQAISVVGLFLAILSLVVALFLFWRYKIPRVFGEITGKSARRAVEGMTKQGEAYRPQARTVNLWARQMQLNELLAAELLESLGHTKDVSRQVPVYPKTVPELTIAAGDGTLLRSAAGVAGIVKLKDITVVHTTEMIE